MAQTPCVIVSASNRQLLEAIAADRNRLDKHDERAQVALASADLRPVQHVAHEISVSRSMV
jgi:hypothetical protein